MTTIDRRKTWEAIENRLEWEQDPILRRNLETVLEHMHGEAAGDVDRLMATLNSDPHYHNYGGPAPSEFRGRDAVRRFYEMFVKSGCEQIEHPAEVLVVDRHCIVTDGVSRIAFPGRTLRKRGIEVDDPDAYYLYEGRSLIIWPFDEDGLLRAEDAYWGSDGFVGIEDRKLQPGDILPLDPALLAPRGRFVQKSHQVTADAS